VVTAVNNGLSQRAASRHFGVSRPAVSDWMKRYREGGGGATPTQVMREWIEAGLAAEGSYADAVVPLSAVRAALAELIEHSEPGTTPTDPTRKGLIRRRTA
jgi:transposase-like protein